MSAAEAHDWCDTSEGRVLEAALALITAERGQHPWSAQHAEYARAQLVEVCKEHGARTLVAALKSLAEAWLEHPESMVRHDCGASLLGMLAAAGVHDPDQP